MKAEFGLMQLNCDQICKEKQNIDIDSFLLQSVVTDRLCIYIYIYIYIYVQIMYVCKLALEVALNYLLHGAESFLRS